MLQFTKEIKEMWVEALKSGKYEHGTGQLVKDNKFCCLGVLAEIHPDLEINSSGRNCVGDTGYQCFVDMLNYENVSVLYNTNDNHDSFDAVIPIIENIPTVD